MITTGLVGTDDLHGLCVAQMVKAMRTMRPANLLSHALQALEPDWNLPDARETSAPSSLTLDTDGPAEGTTS